jgi:hypothetical protein
LYNWAYNFGNLYSRSEKSVMLDSRAENFGKLYSTTQKTLDDHSRKPEV